MRDYLRVTFGNDGLFGDVVFSISSGDWSSRVFSIPHPRFREEADASMLRAMRVALFPDAESNDAETGGTAEPIVGSGFNVDIVKCEWQPRYGWKPNHNPAHLLWLEGDAKRRIRYQLTRNARWS